MEHATTPEYAAALNRTALRAMAAGDYAAAQDILCRALELDKGNLSGWLNLAAVRRQLAQYTGALEALNSALRLHPRSFPALLMKATLLERQGGARAAAQAYGIALAQAPADEHLDGPTRDAVRRARDIHSRYTEELNDFVRSRAGDAWSQCTPAARKRLDSFIDTTLRRRRRYQQEPLEYFVPGLPAIEFYEREQFPWIEEFEAATGDIRRELQTILREDQGGFAPYVQYADHLPLDQWRELNHSPLWSAFHFYRRGLPIEDHCARAPATVQALSKLPQAQAPLRSPAGMFSVLQPKARIPPHTGVANFRLVVHLPLIVPPGCGFRVGGETREWRAGEAWVFDDTIEHEAWNDSNEIRIILIADIWSPYLSPEERAAICEILAATDAFSGVAPADQI